MKIFQISLTLIIILFGFGVGAFNSSNLGNPDYFVNSPTYINEYSHRVFVEVASSQACPGCSDWNDALYNTFSSGNYEFNYVSMIFYGTGGSSDILNTKAYDWKNLYDISATPTSIIDGDYRRMVGSSVNNFLTKIEESGERNVHDIDASMDITWLGNATFQIDIKIENNEDNIYNGYIRVPISEINSRYETNSGKNYYFGFLDYAYPMNTEITISGGGTYLNSVTWNGNNHQDNHGTNFGDIIKDNIQLFLNVYNSDDNYLDESLARKIDENQPPDKPLITGPNVGLSNEEYNYSFFTTDPENDYISYFIDWGDGQTQGWLGPYVSGQEIILGHIFEKDGFYEIKAKAIDENQAESYWSRPFYVTIGNVPPDKPDISGPNSGRIGDSYEYTFITNDKNGDDIYYADIEWDDGSNSGLLGPYESGEIVSVSHIWQEGGTFTIRAKAVDVHGSESDWGEMKVTMPRNHFKGYIFQNLLIFLKEFFYFL